MSFGEKLNTFLLGVYLGVEVLHSRQYIHLDY